MKKIITLFAIALIAFVVFLSAGCSSENVQSSTVAVEDYGLAGMEWNSYEAHEQAQTCAAYFDTPKDDFIQTLVEKGDWPETMAMDLYDILNQECG